VKLPWKRAEPVHERLRREAEREGALAGDAPYADDFEDDAEAIDAGAEAEDVENGGTENGDAFGQSPFDAMYNSSADQGELSFLGVPRIRGDWDLVVTAEAPALTGADELGFVALENGDIFMDSQLPEGDVTPLAEAIEMQLEPPYRAFGVRQQGDLWAVAAREIEIGRFETAGDEIELMVRGDEQELVVDGRRSFGSIPELEEMGRSLADEFFVRAVRVDDDVWEITIHQI
jgi:hypothetical protein